MDYQEEQEVEHDDTRSIAELFDWRPCNMGWRPEDESA